MRLAQRLGRTFRWLVAIASWMLTAPLAVALGLWSIFLALRYLCAGLMLAFDWATGELDDARKKMVLWYRYACPACGAYDLRRVREESRYELECGSCGFPSRLDSRGNRVLPRAVGKC